MTALLDTDITLSLPYNHDPRYPEWLSTRWDGVSEVYLPVHRSVGVTGRAWSGPDDHEAYIERLRELAAVLHPHAIKGNLVINSTIFSDQRAAVIAEITRMREVFEPLLVVTLSDFDLATQIRRSFPDLAIGVSTIAGVASVQRARYWLDQVGVESIVVDRDINKSPKLLAAIHRLGVRLKVVLDDMCVPGCAAHLSHLTVDTEGGDRAKGWCCMTKVRQHDPWLVAQKDITPATLPRYAGVIDVAKLQGRQLDLASIERTMDLYLAAESYAHPYGLYEEPPEAFDRITTCDRDCEPCGWCEQSFTFDRR